MDFYLALPRRDYYTEAILSFCQRECEEGVSEITQQALLVFSKFELPARPLAIGWVKLLTKCAFTGALSKFSVTKIVMKFHEVHHFKAEELKADICIHASDGSIPFSRALLLQYPYFHDFVNDIVWKDVSKEVVEAFQSYLYTGKVALTSADSRSQLFDCGRIILDYKLMQLTVGNDERLQALLEGQRHADQGDFTSAELAFVKALKSKEDALTWASVAAVSADNLEYAEFAITRALALNPTDPHLNLKKGQILLKLRKKSKDARVERLQEAEVCLKLAQKGLKTDALFQDLASIYLKKGMLIEAQALLKELCQMAPEEPYFRCLLAKAYCLDRQFSTAKPILKPLCEKTAGTRERFFALQEMILLCLLTEDAELDSYIAELISFTQNYSSFKKILKGAPEKIPALFAALPKENLGLRNFVIEFLLERGSVADRTTADKYLSQAQRIDPDSILIHQSHWMRHYLSPDVIGECRAQLTEGDFTQLCEAFQFFSGDNITLPQERPGRKSVVQWVDLFIEGAKAGELNKAKVGQLLSTFHSVLRFTESELISHVRFNSTLLPIALLLQFPFFHPFIHRNQAETSLYDKSLSKPQLLAFRAYLFYGKLPEDPALLNSLFNWARAIQASSLMQGCYEKGVKWEAPELEYGIKNLLAVLRRQNRAAIHLALARLYLAEEEDENCERHLNQSLALDMAPYELLQCGELFYKLQKCCRDPLKRVANLKTAARCLKVAQRSMPDHEELLELLGKVSLKLNDAEWPEGCFEALHQYYPERLGPALLFAKSLCLTHDFDEAESILKPFQDKSEKLWALSISISLLKGEREAATNSLASLPAERNEILSRVIKLLVQAEALDKLDLFFELIKVSEKEDLLHKTVYTKILVKQAEYLLQQNLPGARELAERAYRIDHNATAALNILGDIYSQEGFLSAAANFFKKSLSLLEDPEVRKRLTLVLLKESEKLREEALLTDPDYFANLEGAAFF